MYRIIKYTDHYRREWDEIITNSKLSTFLFFREFLEYHSEKYRECSFLFSKKDKIVAVIPGNSSSDTFYSHQFLTFGGFVTLNEVKQTDVIHMFDLLNHELKRIGIKSVVYKAVPYIYHNIPSQEDIYALFKLGAEKIACDISSTILPQNKLEYSKSRRNGLKISQKQEIEVVESEDYGSFWKILTTNLKRKFNTYPVHSLEEIQNLKSKFPENIRLFLAVEKNEILAGAVVFYTEKVAHTQYLAASDRGKKTGGLDIIIHKLVTKVFSTVPYFDIGKSTEEMGKYLNESLIFQKEGFGGRGVVYETYQYKI